MVAELDLNLCRQVPLYKCSLLACEFRICYATILISSCCQSLFGILHGAVAS